MAMFDLFFYIFSALTVGAALLVVLNRNAVNAAMFLIVSFVGMAALFVLLEAYFLAALQVLVYAGAIVVLFLFIVMLLDVKGGGHKRFGPANIAAASISSLLLVGAVFALFGGGHLASPDRESVPAFGATLGYYGQMLFTTYLLPLMVTAFLLLVAMIGVIVLSKRSGQSPRPSRLTRN
jgi:NADH-quinone oxidoreductase subunit J